MKLLVTAAVGLALMTPAVFASQPKGHEAQKSQDAQKDNIAKQQPKMTPAKRIANCVAGTAFLAGSAGAIFGMIIAGQALTAAISKEQKDHGNYAVALDTVVSLCAAAAATYGLYEFFLKNTAKHFKKAFGEVETSQAS